MPKVLGVRQKVSRTDYIVAVLCAGNPGWIQLDYAQVGAPISTNDSQLSVTRMARVSEAPWVSLRAIPQTQVLLGTEINIISGDPADVATVCGNVFLHVGENRQDGFTRPLSHLIATPDSILAHRIARLEDVLRNYLQSINNSAAGQLPDHAISAVREALQRLGAPLLVDHRRLQIPLCWQAGEAVELRLSWQHPLPLTGPVELRLCLEWVLTIDVA